MGREFILAYDSIMTGKTGQWEVKEWSGSRRSNGHATSSLRKLQLASLSIKEVHNLICRFSEYTKGNGDI